MPNLLISNQVLGLHMFHVSKYPRRTLLPNYVFVQNFNLTDAINIVET